MDSSEQNKTEKIVFSRDTIYDTYGGGREVLGEFEPGINILAGTLR